MAPLSLEEAIEIALRQHAAPAIAAQGAISAAQRVITARSANLPRVEATAGYANSAVRGTRAGTSTTLAGSSRDVDLVVSQRLFDLGLTRARVRQAQAGARGAEAQVGSSRVNTVFNVTASYFEQLRAERLLGLREQQVQQARQNLELVRGQVEAGAAAPVDQQPVEVELRQQEFNLAAARNNLRTATNNFRNALGFDVGPALPLEPVTAPTVAEVPPLPAEIEAARRLRPDLALARTQVEAAEAGRTVARIESGPQIVADASLGLGRTENGNRGNRGVTVGLSLPIFSGGANRAARREADAALESARLNQQQAAKDAEADVAEAHSAARSAAERLPAARALVASAEVSLAAAQEKFREGLGITLEVINAQVQLFNAQTSLTEAIYDYYLARAAMERAVGRWGSGRGTFTLYQPRDEEAVTP